MHVQNELHFTISHNVVNTSFRSTPREKYTVGVFWWSIFSLVALVPRVFLHRPTKKEEQNYAMVWNPPFMQDALEYFYRHGVILSFLDFSPVWWVEKLRHWRVLHQLDKMIYLEVQIFTSRCQLIGMPWAKICQVDKNDPHTGLVGSTITPLAYFYVS